MEGENIDTPEPQEAPNKSEGLPEVEAKELPEEDLEDYFKEEPKKPGEKPKLSFMERWAVNWKNALIILLLVALCIVMLVANTSHNEVVGAYNACAEAYNTLFKYASINCSCFMP